MISRKSISIILAILLFFVLTLSTGLCLTAEYFSLKQSFTLRQGYVSDSSTSWSDGITSFKMIDENGIIIGKHSSETFVLDGQIVSVVVLKDTLYFPLLYNPREWQEIYVGENLIETKEPHIYITIIAILWAATLIIASFMTYRYITQ